MGKLAICVTLLTALAVTCSSESVADPCPPRACPRHLDPVCGSDGVTYPNQCVFESDTCGTGVTVAHAGRCAETLPCEQRTACPLLYGPVCGSDGVTYDNTCLLEVRNCGTGVTVSHPGNC